VNDAPPRAERSCRSSMLLALKRQRRMRCVLTRRSNLCRSLKSTPTESSAAITGWSCRCQGSRLPVRVGLAMLCRTPLDPYGCSCRTNAKGYNLNRMWNQSSEVRLPSSQGRQHFRHNAVAGCLQRDRELLASCSHQMKLYNVRLRYCHSWGRCVRRRRLRRYSSLKMQCTDTASTCSWTFTVSCFLAHVAIFPFTSSAAR